MKIKIKDQKRDFNPSISPEDFIYENIDNLEGIYAKENNITSEEAHNLQLNFRSEMQITIIWKMVECYGAFILLNY